MASTNLATNPIQIAGSVTGFKAQLAALSPSGGINNTSYGTLRILRITHVRWVNPPATSSLNIGDPVSGEVLLALTSTTAGLDVDVSFDANPVLWDDFAIDTFPGGTLYLWNRGC